MQTPGQHERREHKKRAGCGGKILHKSTKNHFFKFWVPKKFQFLAKKSINETLICRLLPSFILHLSRPVVFLSGEPKPRNLISNPSPLGGGIKISGLALEGCGAPRKAGFAHPPKLCGRGRCQKKAAFGRTPTPCGKAWFPFRVLRRD